MRLRCGNAYRALLAGGGFVLSATALPGCREARGNSSRLVNGGDADRGTRAIAKYGCGACHMIPGIHDADGMVGPPLMWFGRRTMVAGELPNTQENLIRWIEHPDSVEPSTDMPALGVTDQDARDIAAYLYTLR
jgi:cytochrome c1